MVMDFWKAQRRARRQTTLYLVLFFLLTLLAAVLLEFGIRYYSQGEVQSQYGSTPYDSTLYDSTPYDSISYNSSFPYFGFTFLVITLIASSIQYLCFMSVGGKYVAESMGGELAQASEPKEAMLLNIVQECAIASSLPVPAVYIIDAEQINAFAAGLKADNAAIAITRGALDKLSRDEIQGVIAHEFGHISNGDMIIGLRLAAMLMGFYFILYFAMRMLQFSSSDRNSRGQNPILLVALLFLFAGGFAWLFGSMLKAAVSRQREYLADASSVQFTRNPEGLVNALKKIHNEQINDMPKTGMAYSHLYLDDHASIFSTHPPIKKRIKAIEGNADL